MTKKEFLLVAIITFITICAWVIFDIVHRTAEVEIPSKIQQLSEPIEPNFDLGAVGL